MKKIFFFFILLIIAVIIWFKYFAGHQAAKYISSYLTDAMKVPVTIEQIVFKKRAFALDNLIIENPKESKLHVALSARETQFFAPYSHYLKSHIEIDEIDINDMYIGIEFYDQKQNRGNWTTLIHNLNTPVKKKKKEKSVFIKFLSINNVAIELVFPGKKPIRLSPIKHIEFRDLSSEKGLPIEQITQLITSELLKQISVMEGLQNMIEGIFQVPKQLIKPFGGLFGSKDFLDDARKESEDTVNL